MSGVNSQPERVCVLGGGVTGTFIAYRLACEGIQVSLLEKERLGAGASGASAGNVQTLSGSFQGFQRELGQESLELYRKLMPSIKEESGIDPLDQETRYLYGAMSEEQVVEIRGEEASLLQDGMKVEWIDGQDARTIEPRFSPHLLGGLLHSDCIQMDAGRFVNALGRAAQKKGAYIAGSEVVGLERDASRVAGVHRNDGTVLYCDLVIVAMGAWTGPALLDWLNLDLPIRPQSLQKLHLLMGDSPLNCAVRWDGVNIVSRRDSMTHVGSKQDLFGFDAHPTEEGKQWLMKNVNTILPGLDASIAEAWAGCAVATPDTVPIVGPITEHDGLYVAVPSSNGFLLAALLADIITKSLMKGEEHHFASELLPERAIARYASGTQPTN